MSDRLVSIQSAAALQLQQNFLHTNKLAPDALKQLQQACYPVSRYQAYNKRPTLLRLMQSLPGQLNCSYHQLAQLLVLKLLADFSVQQLSVTIPPDIYTNYLRSMQRIFQLWTTEPAAEQHQINDRFLKDIALLTGALLPCSERVVQPFSALQRSLLFNNGIMQGWQFIKSLIAASGNKPVCRLHVHLAEINSLTAEGWRSTCQQLAQLLTHNPQLKGVVGASWFYDPAIATLSPNLAFISKQLHEMQASWFFSNLEHEKSGALQRSANRQQAFKAGTYQPKCYVVFITRRQLLNWYQRQPKC